MASSLERVGGEDEMIRFVYSVKTYVVENETLNSSLKAAAPAISAVAPASATASVVFKVQYNLRIRLARGNPLTEFLQEEDWQPSRESSSLELPWSTDEGRLIIDLDDDDDDNNNVQISQALTLLRVPKFLHQWIMDILRKRPAAISPLPGLAPKMVVHLSEVTQITLPLISEEGKAIYPEYVDDEMYDPVNCPPRTEEEEEIAQAKFNDFVKKYIVGVGDMSEEDEDALIEDRFVKLTRAIFKIAWQQYIEEVEEAKVEEEAKEEEQEKAAKEEKEEENEAREEDVKKEAKVEKEGEEGREQGPKEEEELTCLICMEIILEADDGTWRLMPCCTQVFHRDCISKWTKRVKKCPWCRSSLPLVLQSAKGFVHRIESGDLYCPSVPGVHDLLLVLWHVLSKTVWWMNGAGHDVGCKCGGCQTAHMDLIRA